MLHSSAELNKLLEELYIKFMWKMRKDTHISDLDTPRRSLYNRLYPSRPEMASILNFVRGESSHSYFRDVMSQLPEARIEAPGKFMSPCGNPLLCHVDTLFVKGDNWPTGVVWEFKSTLGTKPKETWIKRTHGYMALFDVQFGVLPVHYLLQNKIQCYPIELGQKYLDNLKSSLLYLTDMFVDGLEKRENPFPQCVNCAVVGKYCEHRERCKRDGYSVPELFPSNRPGGPKIVHK